MLLCTTYRRFPGDYTTIVNAPRRVCPGLRFIKQNVPEVEILEYPMWRQYVKRLKQGWDVVGFSFYQNELTEIHKMIAEARRQGIKEIWAGNYGALDYSIPPVVDRVFTGPAEDDVARVFGRRVRNEDIQHPAMMVHFSIVPGLRAQTFGLLYTAHGCPYKCSFCQTPVFERERFTINLESIERVLRYYKKLGITYLFPMDELFGIFPKFTDELTRMFARYRFHWWAQSRASIFTRNLDDWYERGLRITAVGVESMFQSSLDGMNKSQNIEEIYEFIRRSEEKRALFRIGYFMTGHEGMTAEETLEDALCMRRAGFDTHTVSVMTPFPRTDLWERIAATRGIIDYEPRHYSLQHLVWNHPYITPGQMRYLQNYIIKILVKYSDFISNGISRLIWGGLRKEGFEMLWRHVLKGPVVANVLKDKKLYFFNDCESKS
ncbi:radical SAM protein [candidate division WOR-3 bacterium]|nr:radical SAM protein [candidate division WOR-3 bacterium]